MMNLKKIINEGVKDENINLLYDVTTLLTDTLEKNLPEEDYTGLCKKIYSFLNGGHFNKEFAEMAMKKMYYEDEVKVLAPYYTEENVRKIYEEVKGKIPKEYNFYDFEVTLNMIYSDYFLLLCKWSEEKRNTTTLPVEWVEQKIVELTVNWLNDEDNPFGKCKIWGYLNGK